VPIGTRLAYRETERGEIMFKLTMAQQEVVCRFVPTQSAIIPLLDACTAFARSNDPASSIATFRHSLQAFLLDIHMDAKTQEDKGMMLFRIFRHSPFQYTAEVSSERGNARSRVRIDAAPPQADASRWEEVLSHSKATATPIRGKAATSSRS